MKIQDIYTALPKLSKEELKGIRDRCDILLGISNEGAATGKNPTSGSALLYKVAQEQVEDRYGFRLAPLGQLGKMQLKSQYTSAEQAADGYLQKALGKHTTLTMQQRAAAYKILVNLCLNNLEQMELPITTRTVVQALPNGVSLIENEFPGYAAAGMLYWIFENRSI